MTAAVVVLAVLCFALAAALVAERMGPRQNELTRFCRDEHDRTLATGEAFKAFAERDAERDRLVMDALIADRQRLVTALLAAGPNPNAARITGMVDQAAAQTARSTNMREAMIEAMRDNGQGPDTEYATGDGHPIVPVGMGNAL